MKPGITISIATVNRPSFLMTLSSILTIDDLEYITEVHIIYKDSKPDYVNSHEAKHIYSILEHYDIEVKRFVDIGKGIGQARALQLKYYKHGYLMIIDDDVILDSNVVFELYDELYSHEDDNVAVVLPKMLSNYDPNEQLGKTFVDMRSAEIDEYDIETNSFIHVLVPFMNFEPCIIDYDILYAICSMINMELIGDENIEYMQQILRIWSPVHGYEDRWIGKYLLSKGFKIWLDGYGTCYHLMTPSESRKWESEINCDDELNLLDNLLQRPFINNEAQNR